MSNSQMFGLEKGLKIPAGSSRIAVPEIAKRLNIGRLTVYTMLRQGILPGVRLGRRWIITRYAYERWERTCGFRSQPGLEPDTEVSVLN